MTEIPLEQHIVPSGEQMIVRDLASCPPPERWHDWVEYDAKAWPRKVERHYSIIPTICFNCETACGLMAYGDKETGHVKKFEGNPYHPGSRGRNCAKGPATINQVNDPERILYPLRRNGKRGEGKWERTTWDEVLDTFATKIRAAIIEDRRDEIMYHVVRPGHDGYMERVLGAWGVDGHNSHTNVHPDTMNHDMGEYLLIWDAGVLKLARVLTVGFPLWLNLQKSMMASGSCAN